MYPDNKKLSIAIIGCGWLGLACAKRFLALGYKVLGTCRTEEKKKQLLLLGIDAYCFQLEEEWSMDAPFLNADCVIVNIPSKAVVYFEHLCVALKMNACGKVIFTSSTSVYPFVNREIDETAPVLPSHPLVSIENYFIELNNIKPTTIIRFAGLIGGKRHPGNFFKNKAISQPKSRVNLILQQDAVEVLIQLVKQDVWGEVFNACADQHPFKLAYYTQATYALHQQEVIVEDNQEEIQSKIISNKKIKASLDVKFSNINDFGENHYHTLA